MKQPCTRCGTEVEIDPANPKAAGNCPGCGHPLTPPPPVAASSARSSRGLLIIAGLLAVPLLGMLAAIVIPSLVGSADKQGECKANLRKLHLSQVSYFQKHQEYTVKLHRVGFKPERANRYAYYADLTGIIDEPGSPPSTEATGIGPDLRRYPESKVTVNDVPAQLAGGVKVGGIGACPDCQLTTVCIANLDADPTFDVWSLSTQDRLGASGEVIPAGQPHNELNDLQP